MVPLLPPPWHPAGSPDPHPHPKRPEGSRPAPGGCCSRRRHYMTSRRNHCKEVHSKQSSVCGYMFPWDRPQCGGLFRWSVGSGWQHVQLGAGPGQLAARSCWSFAQLGQVVTKHDMWCSSAVTSHCQDARGHTIQRQAACKSPVRQFVACALLPGEFSRRSSHLVRVSSHSHVAYCGLSSQPLKPLVGTATSTLLSRPSPDV